MKSWELSRIRENAAMQAASKICLWEGHAEGFEKWMASVMHLAYMLNLKDYLDGTAIFPTSFETGRLSTDNSSTVSEIILNHKVTTEDAEDFDDNNSDSSFKVMSEDGSVPERGNAAPMSIEEYEYKRQNFDVIFNAIWGSIKDSPTLMSIANLDGAMDRHDTIQVVINIRSQYVLASGLGLLSVFEELFTLPSENKDTEQLITSLELIQRRLSDRGYKIDDIILVAMLTKCLRSNKLKDELNTKVTKYLINKRVLMFTKAVEYVRVFENNRKSSYIKNNTKSTNFKRSSSDVEGIKALAATKVTSDLTSTASSNAPKNTSSFNKSCFNCGGNHHIKDCTNGCMKCKSFTHLPKDCPQRQSTKKTGCAVKCPTVLHVCHNKFNAIIDSGCNGNFVHDPHLLSDFNSKVEGVNAVMMADNSKIPIKGSGVLMETLIGDYVPSLSGTLLSVSSLAEAGSLIIFDKHSATVLRNSDLIQKLFDEIKDVAQNENNVILTADNIDGLYQTFIKPVDQQDKFAGAGYYYASTKMTNLDELVRYWHEALGHLSMEQMIQIVRQQLYEGLPPELNESVVRKHFPTCVECSLGNLATSPLPECSDSIVTNPGDVVEVDFKGPMTNASGEIIKTFSGRKYCFVSVDIATDMTHVTLVKETKHPHTLITKLINLYKAAGHPIKILRADHAFATELVKELCQQNNITLQITVPYEHGQLGHVERKHRTLAEQVIKVMGNKSHVVPQMWGMAITDCVYKSNFLPKQRLGWKTSAFLWNGSVLNVKKTPIIPFGSIVMAHVPTKLQTGLGARSFTTIAIGSTPGIKGGILLYNPKTKRTVVRRTFKVIGPDLPPPSNAPMHITFERGTISPEAIELPMDSDPFLDVESLSSKTASPEPRSEDIATSITDHTSSLIPNDCAITMEEIPTNMDLDPSVSDISVIPTPIPFPSVPNNKPHRKKKTNVQFSESAILEETNPYKKFYPSRHIHKVHYTNPNIPKCVQYINRLPDAEAWHAAVHSEIQSMFTSGTLLPLSIPESDISKYSVLKTQLIFDIRYNADGTPKKYKVRLVGRGDLQPWDSYGETYAGTANIRSVFMMLGIAAEQDLELEALDVKTAFLYPIYDGPKLIVVRPSGLTDADMPQYMELGKCIYGLKQAARAFREHLDLSLKGIGFLPTRADPCVYIKHVDSDYILACVHVDDIGLAGTSTAIITDTKQHLSKIYELTSNPNMDSYLGMNIKRDREKKSLFVFQGGYIDSLLNDYQVSYGKPPSTPMAISAIDSDCATQLTELSPERIRDYQARVGSLLYLYAVTSCARKCKSPTDQDWNAVVRILRYISSTRDLGLTFHSGEGIILYATSDASYASHVDRKSHTGCTLHIGRTSCSFYSHCKKQDVTALSSTEAEFVATTEAAKEITWARLLLAELGFPQLQPTVLYEDNQSTIKLITSDSYRSKTKHIDVRYHYVREQFTGGTVTIEYLPTDEMTSDILTKSLGTGSFTYLRSKLLGISRL